MTTVAYDEDCSLGEADFTDKSDDGVGHLNTILARGGGNLNNPIFKSSNVRGLPAGGMLKFRLDRCIRMITKSDDRVAGVRFVYHEYDYRQNWATRSPITN